MLIHWREGFESGLHIHFGQPGRGGACLFSGALWKRINQNVANMEFVRPPVPVGCSTVRRDFGVDGFRPVFCARRTGATGSLLCYSCGPARTRVRSSAYSINRLDAEAPLLRATVSLLNSLRRVLKIKPGFRSAANVSVTFSKFSWFFWTALR